MHTVRVNNVKKRRLKGKGFFLHKFLVFRKLIFFNVKYAEVGVCSCLMWLHFKITREWQSTSQVEQRFCRILIFIALT